MGKPVALEASALDRLTRAIISITRRLAGVRVYRELDVRATGLDTNATKDGDRRRRAWPDTQRPTGF